MLSQSKNSLLDAVYRFGGFVTVPAVMAWRHISSAGARKAIGELRNLGYLETVEFSGTMNYPAIHRINSAGISYLQRHQVREIDEMYSYSVLYKVLRSHTLFELAGDGVTDVITENAEKIRYLCSLGFTEQQFDRKMNHDTPYPYFGDYIIRDKKGFTSLFVDRPWNDARGILETRLEHLQKYLKAETVRINLLISTDRKERKEAYEWAYDGLYGMEKPEKFNCMQLNYCYSRQ